MPGNFRTDNGWETHMRNEEWIAVLHHLCSLRYRIEALLWNWSAESCHLDRPCMALDEEVEKYSRPRLVVWYAGAQGLLNVIPEISDLANCSFVYNTFNTFVNSRCNPAKSALRNLWIPLLLLSIALTLLPIFWTLANHRNTQQRYLGTIHAQDYRPRPLPNWETVGNGDWSRIWQWSVFPPSISWTSQAVLYVK